MDFKKRLLATGLLVTAPFTASCIRQETRDQMATLETHVATLASDADRAQFFADEAERIVKEQIRNHMRRILVPETPLYNGIKQVEDRDTRQAFNNVLTAHAALNPEIKIAVNRRLSGIIEQIQDRENGIQNLAEIVYPGNAENQKLVTINSGFAVYELRDRAKAPIDAFIGATHLRP